MRLAFVGLFLMVASMTVRAIDLGPIIIESSPNEPLLARVPVTDLGAVDPFQLVPSLASQAEFQSLGVPRLDVLSNLDFRVAPGDGVAQVIITTREPLREPGIEFLLELLTPSGSVVRGYSLLLDPPDVPGPGAPPSVAVR